MVVADYRALIWKWILCDYLLCLPVRSILFTSRLSSFDLNQEARGIAALSILLECLADDLSTVLHIDDLLLLLLTTYVVFSHWLETSYTSARFSR